MAIIRTDQNLASVLVVESDPLMLTAMGSVMDMQGHRVVLARTEPVAVQAIEQQRFDTIVLSIEQLQAGCDFASRLRNFPNTQDVPLIFLVPQLTADWNAKLSAHGGVYCMLKPVDPHGLIDLIEKTLWMPHLAGNRTTVKPPALSGNHLGKPINAAPSDWVRLD